MGLERKRWEEGVEGRKGGGGRGSGVVPIVGSYLDR